MFASSFLQIVVICNYYIYHIIWSNYSDLTRLHPKWWFSKGIPLFQGNLGWWNIIQFRPILSLGNNICYSFGRTEPPFWVSWDFATKRRMIHHRKLQLLEVGPANGSPRSLQINHLFVMWPETHIIHSLVGGFYFFSPLFGEDSHFD